MKTDIFYPKADLDLPKASRTHDNALDKQVTELAKRLCGPSLTITAHPSKGTFHFIYEIATANQEIFIKISKFDELKSSLLLEHYLYTQKLPACGISLDVLGIDLSCNELPFPWLALKRAPGICLKQMDLGDKSLSAIIYNLGRLVSKCHAIKAKTGCGLVSKQSLNDPDPKLKGSQESWKDYIYLNFEKHIKYSSDCLGIDPDDGKNILDLFDHHWAKLEDGKYDNLLHGDLGSHNLFYCPGDNPSITCLIDWEDALIGDPVFDIASFASFHRMHEFLDCFLAGYGNEHPTPQFYFKIWMYYLRIVTAKCVLRHKLGYDKLGFSVSKPKIKLALKKIEEIL